MIWELIETAPDNQKQILVGFMGEYSWYSYVADANGKETGKYMQFAKPTHWTKIIPPIL